MLEVTLCTPDSTKRLLSFDGEMLRLDDISIYNARHNNTASSLLRLTMQAPDIEITIDELVGGGARNRGNIYAAMTTVNYRIEPHINYSPWQRRQFERSRGRAIFNAVSLVVLEGIPPDAEHEPVNVLKKTSDRVTIWSEGALKGTSEVSTCVSALWRDPLSRTVYYHLVVGQQYLTLEDIRILCAEEMGLLPSQVEPREIHQAMSRIVSVAQKYGFYNRIGLKTSKDSKGRDIGRFAWLPYKHRRLTNGGTST